MELSRKDKEPPKRNSRLAFDVDVPVSYLIDVVE